MEICPGFDRNIFLSIFSAINTDGNTHRRFKYEYFEFNEYHSRCWIVIPKVLWKRRATEEQTKGWGKLEHEDFKLTTVERCDYIPNKIPYNLSLLSCNHANHQQSVSSQY